MAYKKGGRARDLYSLATPSRLVETRTQTPSHALGEPFAAATEVLPDSICRVCRNLGNEVWDPGYRERHAHNEGRWHVMPASDVSIAAQQGCPGCEIIAWALEPCMKQIQDDDVHVQVEFGKASVPHWGHLSYCGRDRHIIRGSFHLRLRSKPFEFVEGHPHPANNMPCPWRFIQPINMISRHTGSSAAIVKVKKWYSECISSHKKCLSGSRSPLPTRIIHIKEPKKARLHISGSQSAEYACLSHCWGGQSIVQTTTLNIEQYTVDIPWGELPKTFQDAIYFAYCIGFEYLWIDSLCIIQDSIDDWRQEGSQMARIYSNASMTLSATRASSPHQGCFATLDGPYTWRTKTFTNSVHETYELYCYAKLPQSRTPLFERGWVFQERMLSRRIVHFMDQELLWECRECIQCECEDPHHNDLHLDHNDAFEMSELTSVEDIGARWEEMVERFSKMSLTYPTDIFPAIQALAKLVPPRMGRYLAGHWENTLIPSLGWCVRPSALAERKGWRAPSWSWAAVQGGVCWPRKAVLEICATLLSALIIPKGNDPMGQISYGFVVLRGKFLTGKMQIEPESPRRRRLILEGKRIGELLESIYWWDTTSHDEVDKEVFALKLFCTGEYASISQFWLILQAAEGNEGEFVRIGLLYVEELLIEAGWDAIDAMAVDMEVKIL